MSSSRSPATRASSSTRNRPHSFSLKPRPIARSRSAMLCAFDPVKYCSGGAAAVGGDEPQVGLEAAADQDARFRVAVRRARARPVGYSTKSSISDAGAPEASRSRSPQVSQPRRRLPTGSIVGVRRTLAEVGDERRGGVVRVGQQMPAGEALAFVERLEDERFLLRAHAAQRADPAVERAAARDPRWCGCRARDTASRRSSARRPGGAAGRGWSAEIRR